MAKNQHATKEKSLKNSYEYGVMTVCRKLGVILESKVVKKLSLEKKNLINNGLLNWCT